MPSIASVLTAVAAELRVKLEEADDLDSFAYAGLLPNQQVGAAMIENDLHDGCGVAWVRLVTGYSATALGVPAEGRTQQLCSMVGFDLEIGMTRCYGEAEDDGNVPDPGVIEAAVKQQADDSQFMRSVVLCSGLDPDDFLLAHWQPIGPTGGVLGGAWLIRAVL